MRYLFGLITLPFLISFNAAAQDTSPDDGFIGYIGPTTEAQRKKTPELTLEMPKPPSNFQFTQTGEFVLIYYGGDQFGVYGLDDASQDGHSYSEADAVNILKENYSNHAPPLQCGIHASVDDAAMIRVLDLCRTISKDIRITNIKGPIP